MGSIKKAPWTFEWVPREFMQFIGEKIAANRFVETGTETGVTAEWAAGVFSDVYTCEPAQHWFDKASERLAKFPNVTITHETSWEMLHRMIDWNEEPTVFWLDAHWHLDDTYYGRHEEHPLIKEINLVRARTGVNAIFIDDMRFIVYPFTRPGATQEWPSIVEVIHALHGYEIAIYNDVMVAIPPQFRDLLFQWKKRIKGTELDLL